MPMPYLTGFIVAIAVVAYANALRFDRDRAFYPVILVVIASYYVLFATIDGSAQVVLLESTFAVVFAAAASWGFRRNLWLVAGALGAHGIFDFFHARFIVNAGVPGWWPAFCLAFDLTVAAALGWLLAHRRAE
jgi:hypothetical protein